MSSHELQSALMLTVEFSNIYYKLYQLCHSNNKIPVLETVRIRNISIFLKILPLYIQKALFLKPFGIGHMFI